MTGNAEGLIDIGKLILRFAKVNRVTFHEDGQTPESDTDHTMMLCVSACALASKLYPDSLDMSLVAQFAIVHDLVEAYADDTDSFVIKDEDRKAKENREHEAFLRIKEEFSEVYPWISEMIEKYEKLDTREARFIKTVDKLMPKITHVLNEGAYFRSKGFSRDEMWENYMKLVKRTEEKFGAEFPEVIELAHEIITNARIKAYGS